MFSKLFTLYICLLLALPIYLMFPADVIAAGVTVTLSPGTVTHGQNTTHTIGFVPATGLPNNSLLYLYYPQSYTDASLDSGDFTVTKTGDANYTSAAASVNTTTNVVTFTLTTTGTLDTSNAFSIVIATNQLVPSSTGGVNYSFSIATDNLSGDIDDYGATLQYVGNLNEVQVTAIVPPVLSFAIRNSADNAELAPTGARKLCDLGVMSLVSVATCSYRLKISTNANSGYTVSYSSDGDLDKGADAFDNAVVGDPGSTVVAGTELYGAVLTEGQATGGTITRNANFGTDAADAYKITATAGPHNIYASNGENGPSATDTTYTALMEHRAAIGGGTPIGNYAHIVTYTVAASF